MKLAFLEWKARNTMNFLLALCSATAHSMNSAATRTYQTKIQRSPADFRLYQVIAALMVSFLNFASGGFVLRLDPLGLFLAVCYGVDMAATGILTATCFACGPMSLTSVITNACVVLPIAVGCLWYDEVMTGPQIVGCVLLAATFVLSAVNPQKKAANNAIPAKWYLLVFFAFFCNGVGAVLLNIYGRVAAAGQRSSYLALGYAIAAVLYFCSHRWLVHKHGPVQIKALVRPLLLLVIAMGGFGGFIGNSILMSLNTAMPASLLYPLVNGGIAVIVAIMSCVIFKEKLTLQRALTILVGLAAIVTLNL